ncbi:DMT family transporter [Desulfococcus multivorans]|jgi:drug/metabolite transporter (DMT)-like permease|uniref:EamA domain-containing protein n=1 Tax=Desulfococcus multivorans DSM 2059 TaxID=1121405 RepID=S7UMX6_DESML|nr:DMT family transporter [Desulfococcus multivorans]AOY58659.1 conserved uncharacterized protein, DUF6 [Desulfococcus multivorans]AQV00950.1 EamA family transporter [Desulfococcus multivorans]EPR35314.1 protein of unknown function DUF6 transmembrane [Desulfococcus multivorans DSM 2059]MDX9820258.1 DMT family transporter [Desulfococcus multivorans]SJZ45829.1 hypothetical protein SAMN02745446_00582 [Desulfococcus multivorans DSM 2059]
MKKEYLLGLLTVLLWSTSATAFKLTLGYMDPVQLLFYATLASTVVVWAILAVQGKTMLIFSLKPREYRIFLGLGFLNPFVYYLMLFKAYAHLPAQVAQPINYTWPVMLSLLSVPLLGQRLTRIDLTATLVCYSGVVLVSTKGSLAGFRSLDPIGIILAVSCTVIWALYWICSIRIKAEPIVGLFLCFVFSLPFTAASCILFSQLWVPDVMGLPGAAWVGCFEMGITFVTWLTALKLSDNAGRVANLIFLTPFVSLVFIHFLLGETIYVTTFAGLVLIVSGLLMQKIMAAGP